MEIKRAKGLKIMKTHKKTLYEKFFKRLLDFFGALLAIIILSPLLLVLLLLVRNKMGKPGVFKQLRPGRDEKIFTLYKFRTMTNKTDENGELLPADIRLTPFGKMFRSTSLDELPELFNILKGDMSFVGPRPLLVEYLPRYNEEQKRRHDVRPGLTGLAQVKGRNSISWEEKFKYDVDYVDNITFIKDLKILYMTFSIVFFRKGINTKGEELMESFMGTEKKDQ